MNIITNVFERFSVGTVQRLGNHYAMIPETVQQCVICRRWTVLDSVAFIRDGSWKNLLQLERVVMWSGSFVVPPVLPLSVQCAHRRNIPSARHHSLSCRSHLKPFTTRCPNYAHDNLFQSTMVGFGALRGSAKTRPDSAAVPPNRTSPPSLKVIPTPRPSHASMFHPRDSVAYFRSETRLAVEELINPTPRILSCGRSSSDAVAILLRSGYTKK